MKKIPSYITVEYLRENTDMVFVFGDNLIRKGIGGAAKLRRQPNTYGFITKKYPDNKEESFFKPDEYLPVFENEMVKLIKEIEMHRDKTYLISKLGAGLANRYHIYEQIILPRIGLLRKYDNVEFL